MDTDKDPFEEYYEEASSKSSQAETAKEILSRLEAKAALNEKEKNSTEDANIIREPINAFIKSMNALIGKVFTEANEKKIRTDLIITMVIGGLAFTVANVFYLITKNHKVKMAPEEYEATFFGMFQTAIKDIGKKEG